MRVTIIFTCLLLIIQSCHQEKDTNLKERESDLKNYYSQVLKSNPPSDGIIIIVQNQRCSACRLDVFNNFSNLLNNSFLPKTFIMHNYDTSILNLVTNKNDLVVKIDSTHKLQQYGLDFAADLYLQFKKGRLVKSFEISNNNIDSLKQLE